MSGSRRQPEQSRPISSGAVTVTAYIVRRGESPGLEAFTRWCCGVDVETVEAEAPVPVEDRVRGLGGEIRRRGGRRGRRRGGGGRGGAGDGGPRGGGGPGRGPPRGGRPALPPPPPLR